VAERLWRDHGKRVAVEFPSPKTGGAWQLTNLGFAGYLPLSTELGVLLAPKVPVGNLFRMLAYAYDLKNLTFFDDLVGFASIQEAYEHLAELLARRVLDRARKGLHRDYEPRAGRLQHLRGRIDIEAAARAPWRVGLPVRYAEHTADVDDNRLLAWTLERIARSGVCRGQALRTVRRAHRVLQGSVAAPPFAARDAVGRQYTRLNDDYGTLHALCRFFLEHSGPTHELGEHRMLPFVVDMAQLFERFVSAWLKAHLPPHLSVRAQETVTVGGMGGPKFRIDLVITEQETRRVVYVLDTKYKTAGQVDPADVAQAVTYAELKRSPAAVLLFPGKSASLLEAYVGEILVRSMVFDVGGELDLAGLEFLNQII
jgi:5-methylcytosine-specific restriction enzyme subunit McrC